MVNVYAGTDTPFAAAVTTGKETSYVRVDDSKIFLNQMAAILDMFESGRVNIDRAESLMIRRILDAAELPEARQGFVAV